MRNPSFTAGLALMLSVWPVCASELEGQRLFTSMDQRAKLDAARQSLSELTDESKRTESTFSTDKLTTNPLQIQGIVKRTRAANTVWIDGRMHTQGVPSQRLKIIAIDRKQVSLAIDGRVELRPIGSSLLFAPNEGLQ